MLVPAKLLDCPCVSFYLSRDVTKYKLIKSRFLGKMRIDTYIRKKTSKIVFFVCNMQLFLDIFFLNFQCFSVFNLTNLSIFLQKLGGFH